MNKLRHYWTPIVFFLLAWFAGITLVFFGTYYWFHRRINHITVPTPWGELPYLMAPVFLTVGLTTAVLNMVWNMVFATIIFLRLPVWRNESGRLSPFFTTRLNQYRRLGLHPVLTEFLIRVIQRYDPDHFGGV